MNLLELAANALNAVSIVLAGRNSIQTWWTGVAGCSLFGVLFFRSKLYADATLQLFFVGTSLVGFALWRARRGAAKELPVRRVAPRMLALAVVAAVAVTIGYGALLQRWTDAAAPFPDSAVLAFSVVGQLLLMQRRVENWWFWLLVNSVAVPLYLSRGLYLTAALSAAFWVNAVVSLRRWRRLVGA